MTPHNDSDDEVLPSAADLDLIAYLDGELDADGIAAVEARLESDKGYAARLQGLQAVSGFVRTDADRIFDAMKVDGIADDVMAKIAAQPKEARPALRAIAGGHKTAAHVQRRKSIVVWGFGSMAAAAAAALFVYSMGGQNGSTAAGVSPPHTAETVAAVVKVTPPPAEIEKAQVEIEDLEVGEGATVVYTGEGGSTAVVFIHENKE